MLAGPEDQMRKPDMDSAAPDGRAPVEFPLSLCWLETATRTIPAACSTLAKSPTRVLPGTTAICCTEAAGAYFKDLDGNTWLDCEMAMGTAPWGHARREVEEAVIAQLRRGVSYSLPAPLEAEVASRLLQRFERYDSLRFCKSGADAVTGAVRIARAATGRQIVVATSYHGWHDWSAYGHYGQNPAPLGIVETVTQTTRWVAGADPAALEQVLAETAGRCAAVVLCPNTWAAADLRRVVDAYRGAGAVVVFDEVTSGIRMGRRATAGEYGIWPDLLCISKGMANGLPLAAVLGPAVLMGRATQVKFSNAHSSECLALAAALACEDLMDLAPEWPTWRVRTTLMIDRLNAEITRLGISDELIVEGTHASFALRSRTADDFWSDPFREHLIRVLAAERIFSKGYLVFSDAHGVEEFEKVEAALMDAVRSWIPDRHTPFSESRSS
ncbi:aminotransferase class III-fold pyridoxal phosphate-dependent enzyme [Streptomyces sp. NPDC060035]|uniref:aminotransferase class III-fold pyridoxal phosphate-dependent enzyme n=1 Tax=Streptomyces sp. NPDC060035 TaxID=3347044 RepID=UPI003687407D